MNFCFSSWNQQPVCEEHFLPAREDKTVEEENAKVEDLSIKGESERNLPDQETVDSTAEILGESCQNESGGENCSRVVGGGGKKKRAKSRRESEGDHDYDDEDNEDDCHTCPNGVAAFISPGQSAKPTLKHTTFSQILTFLKTNLFLPEIILLPPLPSLEDKILQIFGVTGKHSFTR